MKKLNITYWIITGLFAAFMVFSSVPNLMSAPDSVQFLNGYLGYPVYIIPFLGAAKIAGAIALLIPGLRRIKEWAYAGLFFDLGAAFYSLVCVEGFKPGLLVMLVFIGVMFASYFLWHKKLQTEV